MAFEQTDCSSVCWNKWHFDTDVLQTLEKMTANRTREDDRQIQWMQI